MKKILIVFFAGLLEQFGFTLYIIAVNRYMILVSSLLMFVYFLVYLWIINYAVKDTKPLPLLITYAVAAAIGNCIAMSMHLIK